MVQPSLLLMYLTIQKRSCQEKIFSQVFMLLETEIDGRSYFCYNVRNITAGGTPYENAENA